MTPNVIIAITMAHVIMWLYIGLMYPILSVGTVQNTQSVVANRLRSKYGIKLNTFVKDGNHRGYTGLFGTIFINEKWLKREKAFEYIFHHEYCHRQKKHIQIHLLSRLACSLIPMLLLFLDWYFVLPIYLASFKLLAYQKDRFETIANNYADEKIKD